MRLKDGTILLHDGLPYDPVKAHEYYVRNRHLKGRHKGRSVPVRAHTRNVSSKSTYTVRLRNGSTVTLTQKQLVEQQAYAAKRVSDIKTRLTELSDKLKKMIQAAEHKKPAAHKPTTADKRKAAKQSKQYRQKHKQTLANKAKSAKAKAPPKKATTQHYTVAELKSKITDIRTRLKDAINVQRALNTAKPNG